MPQGRRARNPTLADVAARAQVSLSTAARVLRSEPSVNPALAERVRNAANTLGYVPNVLARSLRGGEPRTIGLVVGDMLDPYYGAIAETVTERAESVYSMVAIVSNMQRSPLLELKHCRQLWEHRVAGLILAGGGFDQQTHFGEFKQLVHQIRESGVVMTSLAPRLVDMPTFCPDGAVIGAMMATYILEHGHRHVAVLAGPRGSIATQERIQGMLTVLDNAGVRRHVVHADYTTNAGAQTAASILAEHPTVTAFLAGADSMAVGAIHAAQAIGKRVPEQVSVIGIGNTHIAAFSLPRLTTADAHLSVCAKSALDHIAAAISGHGDRVATIPQPQIVEGASVAVADPR